MEMYDGKGEDKMIKNQSGMTIVELLGVLVVLAIIFLVVIPLIFGAVDRAREETFGLNADRFANTIQNNCLEVQRDKSDVIGHVVVDEYEIDEEATDIAFELDFRGGLPKYGEAYINADCEVAMAVYDDKWCVTRDFGKRTIIVELLEEIGANCSLTFNDFALEIHEINYRSSIGGSISPEMREVLTGGTALAPDVTTEPGYEFSNFTFAGADYVLFENTATGPEGEIQTWQVPETGTYQIEAYGAQGGGSDGGGGESPGPALSP